MPNDEIKQTGTSPDLRTALSNHQIALPEESVERLDRYCRLLWDWNQKLNLTRHLDYDTFVARDVVDTLALSRFLNDDEQVLDIGTGGGVPGIVLAIIRPELEIALVEPVGKKVRVLEDMIAKLGLDVMLHHSRVQDLLAESDEYFDTLVGRAVARLDVLLTWLKPHWGRIGRLLLIKGPKWIDERQAAREKGLLHDKELRRVHSYPLPGIDRESVVLEIRPKPE